jgi:N-acetylmuramoyl-L-alanine amidase
MPYKTLRYLILLLGFILQPILSAAASPFTVVIDPGHGGKDPGTLGSSCKEKDIVLGIGLKLGRLIEERQPDVKIIYTRNTDSFPKLNERAIIANKAHANLFISIHADHSESPNVRGASTFTLGQNRTAENMAIAKRENSVILLEEDYKQRYEGFDPNSAESYIMFEFMQDNYMNQSIQFASTLQEKFVGAGRSDRGVRQDVFLVLRCTSMPSVLVEVGFLSNLEEEQFLKSENGQQQIALSIYRGFSDYRADYDRKSTNSADLAKNSARTSINKPDSSIVSERNSMRIQDSTVKESMESLPVEKKPTAESVVQTHSETSPSNPADTKNSIVFKVQILSTNIKLSTGNKMLKGQKADFYQENNLYKYTVGSFKTFAEANQKRKELAGTFSGAFVIAFENGQKIAVETARAKVNR